MGDGGGQGARSDAGGGNQTGHPVGLVLHSVTRYRPAAPVWPRDLTRAVRVARDFEAGQAGVNRPGPAGVTGARFGG
jgi:hypothetical protein